MIRFKKRLIPFLLKQTLENNLIEKLKQKFQIFQRNIKTNMTKKVRKVNIKTRLND